LAALSSWPGPSASAATAIDRADAVAAVVMLAGLALFARRCLGPARASWLARTVRAGAYAAILGIIPAKAAAERYCYEVAQSHAWLRRYYVVAQLPSGAGHWVLEAFYLLVLGCCMLVVLWVTSAGARLARGAFGLAVGLGLTLGAGLYLSAPLGPRGTAPVGMWLAGNPWLPRPWLTAIVFANWALLLAGPLLLGPIAGRRFTGRGDSRSLAEQRFVQCVAVGMLATVIAVFVMTVGTDATIAVALRSPGASNWLNHGPDLTGTAAYLRNLNAGASEFEYLFLCVGILGTCFIVSFLGAVTVIAAAGEQPPPGSGGRGDGGPPRGEIPPALSPPQSGPAPDVPDRPLVLTG
jgi:hypothetical protein